MKAEATGHSSLFQDNLDGLNESMKMLNNLCLPTLVGSCRRKY